MYLALLELGIKTPIGRKFLFWHVELGIALLMVTVIHHHVYLKGLKECFLERMRWDK